MQGSAARSNQNAQDARHEALTIVVVEGHDETSSHTKSTKHTSNIKTHVCCIYPPNTHGRKEKARAVGFEKENLTDKQA